MKLEAAITGNLHKFMKEQEKAAEVAVTKGIAEITKQAETKLRAQVVSSGLGNRLAKSWRSQVYPKGQTSIKAAGFIYSKAPKLISSFNDGVVIRSKKGLFLAIPTENAPKRGIGGKRISPANFPENIYGKLRFVYRQKGVSLLVVENLKASNGKRGGFRRASESALRTGRGLATAVMFILVPQVALRKRLNYQIIFDQAKLELGESILKHWPQVETNSEKT